MHTLMLTIFCLLVSISGYAADIPSPLSADNSSKQELAVPENNILILKEPTENGIREHRLDLDSDDEMKFTPYREILQKAKEKGLDSIFCVYTDIEGNKEHSRFYRWQFLRKWLANNKSDPFTRKPFNFGNLSYFLIRTCPNTDPLKYDSTFLFHGNNAYIKPLNQTLDDFKKVKPEFSQLSLNKASFYASLVKKYIQVYPDLALKLAQFGLDDIQQDQPQGLLATYRGFFIRTTGDILHTRNNIADAIKAYRMGVHLNDSFSISALSKLCINRSNDDIQKAIRLLKKKADQESDPVTLQHIHTNIIPLCKKTGDEETPNVIHKKILDLKNPLKRKRDNSPKPDQVNLQITPKRERFSTPT